jgi:N-acetylneuraminic acid mutarotase
MAAAGYVKIGTATDDAWSFHPWRAVNEFSSGIRPLVRQGHTAVWSGIENEMIVWGGWNRAVGLLNDGGRYNPDANSWSALATDGAPAPRIGHTALWTGSEMIVWGGSGATGDFGDGGRYNPATNSWRPISSVGAPSPRAFHSAVWTGSEMIIWGGHRLTEALNDGGRYDPENDIWSALTLDGAPVAREFHAAVWTGSEMIIWGGYDGRSNAPSGRFNDGARYDPTANGGLGNWTAVTTVGAPTARTPGRAVWTGSEMIIWGGSDGTGSHFFGDGARYSPASDSWQAMAMLGAPSARDAQTVVWTGSEMWVWGGLQTTEPYLLRDGARYSPASDNWSPFSPGGAPVPRSQHTGVWTGNGLVVWGDLAAGPDSSFDGVWFLAPSNKMYFYLKP